MRTVKQVESELRAVMGKILLHREALQSLDQLRLKLVAEYRTLGGAASSSVPSSEKFGQPGVIQGPPPKEK